MMKRWRVVSFAESVPKTPWSEKVEDNKEGKHEETEVQQKDETVAAATEPNPSEQTQDVEAEP